MRDALKSMGLYVFQVQGGAKPIRSRVLAEKFSLSDRLTVPLSVTYIHTHLKRYLVLALRILARDSGVHFP